MYSSPGKGSCQYSHCLRCVCHFTPFVLMQGRDKERLFEEELEVVWEKGGSGLVFYTDSAYWQEKEGGRGQLLLNI